MIGLKHQRHPPAFHLGIALHLGNQEKLLFYLVEEQSAQIQVRHLATLESKRELHLVSLFQEIAGAVHLDFEIVIPDSNRIDVELLEPAALGISAGLIVLFLLLIAPFAVIHDPANGRACGGSDFDQIEASFAGHSKCVRGGYNPDLFFLVVDEPDRRNADLVIVAELRRNGERLLLFQIYPARHTPGSKVIRP
jgi:hypothetical protein